MKNLVRILLVVIVAFVAFVASRPKHFRVERSAAINASSEVVFDQINSFHRWANWSPWEKIDPAMTRTFEGPESGVGASYRWAGNDKVGAGSMKIMESTPSSQVGIQLEFLKPFKASNVTTFTLTPEGEGTKVNWAMEGDNNFIGKAMCLFMPMDKMVGGDFEKGLATLKGVSESASAAPAAADSTAPAAPGGMSAK